MLLTAILLIIGLIAISASVSTVQRISSETLQEGDDAITLEAGPVQDVLDAIAAEQGGAHDELAASLAHLELVLRAKGYHAQAGFTCDDVDRVWVRFTDGRTDLELTAPIAPC